MVVVLVLVMITLIISGAMATPISGNLGSRLSSATSDLLGNVIKHPNSLDVQEKLLNFADILKDALPFSARGRRSSYIDNTYPGYRRS